jgi:hypothetical protein
MDECIALAVDRYSADRPRLVRAELEGDGTQSLDLPAEFEAGLSVVSEFEYPTGQIPRSLQLDSDWAVNELLATIETPGFTVPDGDTCAVTLTASHVLSGLDGETDATTIPRSDFRTVATLGASYVCERLAAFYAQTSDGTAGADIAGFRSKSQEWDSRAKALRKLYTDALFPKKEDGGVRPRGAFVDWNIGASDGGPYTREPRWAG